jgi:hypothetical protein
LNVVHNVNRRIHKGELVLKGQPFHLAAAVAAAVAAVVATGVAAVHNSGDKGTQVN